MVEAASAIVHEMRFGDNRTCGECAAIIQRHAPSTAAAPELEESIRKTLQINQGNSLDATVRGLSQLFIDKFQHAPSPAAGGDANLKIRLSVLADLWTEQQKEYPNNDIGQAASAAVRCCVNELRTAIAKSTEEAR